MLKIGMITYEESSDELCSSTSGKKKSARKQNLPTCVGEISFSDVTPAGTLKGDAKGRCTEDEGAWGGRPPAAGNCVFFPRKML